ncbi:hypothetical protein BDV96DRAFT_571423 [Lophiotrema nucula]|uniref:Uncharacterized protein n=1 Tax=Lophiotrema nucula TaxID=690887 RepID=A0A6A5ZC09_9PLEO|nr:hypothetical protein BDV96DRAFT_571423 [Lophiotrema nucula]
MPPPVSSDVGAAHSKLLTLQGKLRAINDQKREIDRQREKLRLEALQLFEEYKPVEQDLLAEAERYAKAWGVQFGYTLCTKLPREIRDIIYEELIVSPNSITIDPVHDDDDDPWGGWGLPSWTDTPRPDNWSIRSRAPREQWQHLVCPEYYGPVMSHEILQTFYNCNNFNISIGDLGLLLTSDILQTSHLPLEYIRKLWINVTETSMLHRWNWRAPTTAAAADWDTFYPPLTDVEVTECPADPWPHETGKAAIIDVLSLVPNKQACEVAIVIRTGIHAIKHPLLVNLGGILFRLRDEGFTVEVLQRARKKGKKKRSVADGKCYKFPGSDWTSLFDMSREKWNEKVKTKTISVCAFCSSDCYC